MPRYVAFLRGVSPMNAKMAELKRCFEHAGFEEVKTVLSSGNVVFTARAAAEAGLARKAEMAMAAQLGQPFLTIVRAVKALRQLIDADPYAAFALPPNAKRVVTFLRDRPKSTLALPLELEGARILMANDRHVFTAYVPSKGGAVFMKLIEETFGKSVTTRTWETVKKCVAA
ncbi:MAG: DUF1697 domain-containing protein [Betaproteobacteria bacterium]|nr:MAG: DUF1697 domain-containing protein [Betaproteobacteria bacterium]